MRLRVKKRREEHDRLGGEVLEGGEAWIRVAAPMPEYIFPGLENKGRRVFPVSPALPAEVCGAGEFVAWVLKVGHDSCECELHE